jgi:histidine triad (HIT) family protein
MSDCLFCKFVAGEIPCHVVHEDAEHLAFLTIFPNTEGVTVTIPKKHYTSYVFDVPDDIATKLLLFSKQVARKIDAAYKDDVGRTGVVMEGFGVNHLHYKLYPMHGTAETAKKWEAIESKHATGRPTKFFEHYEGYLSSHDCGQMDDEKLAEIAERIRSAKDQV